MVKSIEELHADTIGLPTANSVMVPQGEPPTITTLKSGHFLVKGDPRGKYAHPWASSRFCRVYRTRAGAEKKLSQLLTQWVSRQ